MSEEKDTLGRFITMAVAITKVTQLNQDLLDSIIRDTREIDKLSDIIDELRDEKASMQTEFYEMVKRGGFDTSPCMNCGESLVCVPEGLALCKTCAAKGGEE